MGDPFGTVAKGLLTEAVRLFDNDERERCEEICRLLLRYPQLGDRPKAGCHLLLAHGTENYVYHAEQAVDLYEHLYEVRPGSSFTGRFQPSSAALQRQAASLRDAQMVLAECQADSRKIEADFARQMASQAQRPTDQQLVEADREGQRESINAYFAQLDAVSADPTDDAEEDFARQMASQEQRPTDQQLVEADREGKRESINAYFAQLDAVSAKPTDEAEEDESDDSAWDNEDLDIVLPATTSMLPSNVQSTPPA